MNGDKKRRHFTVVLPTCNKRVSLNRVSWCIIVMKKLNGVEDRPTVILRGESRYAHSETGSLS